MFFILFVLISNSFSFWMKLFCHQIDSLISFSKRWDLLMHLWMINLWEYDMIPFEMNKMMIIEWLISFEWNGWNFLNYELFLFSLKLFEIVVNINRDVVWNDNWYSWNGTKEKEEFIGCLMNLLFGDDRYGLKDCDILSRDWTKIFILAQNLPKWITFWHIGNEI